MSVARVRFYFFIAIAEGILSSNPKCLDVVTVTPCRRRNDDEIYEPPSTEETMSQRENQLTLATENDGETRDGRPEGQRFVLLEER